MGKRINRRFKYGKVADARLRLIWRVAEGKPFITAADVLFQIAAYASHTGKSFFAGIISADKHTNRLPLVLGFIENPALQAPAHNIIVDAPALEIGQHICGAAPNPRKLERFCVLLLRAYRPAYNCGCRRNRREASAFTNQLVHSVNKTISADFGQIIQSVNGSPTAVPVPIVLKVNEAVMFPVAVHAIAFGD